MADPGIATNPKAFVPLENNPEVMTSLIHSLGTSPSLSFHDVYSLTDPTLLSFVPRPAYALLLVFPITHTYEKFRQAEDASLPEYTGSGLSPSPSPSSSTSSDNDPNNVIWFKQTIRNACGLIGLLHAITNGPPRSLISSTSPLATLLQKAIPLKPMERADLLYESHALEAAHAEAAAKGDTAAPAAEASVDLHFVCFVAEDDHKEGGGKRRLWELDGRRKGPLMRGWLEEGEDVLSEHGLELGVKAFLKREEEAGGGELRFSCVALAPSLD